MMPDAELPLEEDEDADADYASCGWDDVDSDEEP